MLALVLMVLVTVYTRVLLSAKYRHWMPIIMQYFICNEFVHNELHVNKRYMKKVFEFIFGHWGDFHSYSPLLHSAQYGRAFIRRYHIARSGHLSIM